MIILDGEKLREFWDNLAKGLENDPMEVLLWVILVLSLIIIPSLFYIIRRIIAKKRKIKSEKNRFNKIIEEKNLTEDEIDILEGLKSNFNRIKITDILTSPVAFNSCAKRYLNTNNAHGTGLAKLRIKLGMGINNIRSLLHSTAELYPNLKVKVHVGKLGTFKTVINDINKENIEIKANGQLKKDRHVIMEIERDSGCYLIHTSVSGAEEGIIKLRHSEKIEHIQNREFYRKKVKLPVLLKAEDKKYNSYIMDIGGGGVKIKNPGFSALNGSVILLSFNINNKERIYIKSIVERMSEDNTAISLRFENLRESDRDRIMKLVLK